MIIVQLIKSPLHEVAFETNLMTSKSALGGTSVVFLPSLLDSSGSYVSELPIAMLTIVALLVTTRVLIVKFLDSPLAKSPTVQIPFE